MKKEGELAVHGDGKHGKSVQHVEEAIGDGKHGNVVNGSVACKNAGNVRHAGNAARGGIGVGAGYAGVDGSDGGDDKGVGFACDNTGRGGCALVPGPAPQPALCGAWQKDAESAADVELWEEVEKTAVMGQMLEGLGKAFLFYYQIRTLVVRKN